MKTAQGLLARSWEKIVFWCMALLFVLVLVLWFTGFGHEKPMSAATHAAPQQRHYLNPATALAFRTEIPPLNIKNPNPFSYAVRVGPQHVRVPKPTDNAVKPPEKPPVTVTVVPSKPAVTQRMIEYLGSITTASGRRVALLLDRNSGQTSVVEAGGMFAKYKIKSISPKEAGAEDDKGAAVVFALGTPTGIPLE